MINKHLIELMEKIQNNSDYLKNMKDIKDSQKLYDYCSSIVGGYSKEEFDSFAKHLINAEKELQKMPESSLATVSGGTVTDWLKSQLPTFSMPTMPKDAHEFRQKVEQERTVPDGKGGTKTEKVPGPWVSNIAGAAGMLTKGSQAIKVFELMYFNDLDKMPPEEIAMFLLDMTGQT